MWWRSGIQREERSYPQSVDTRLRNDYKYFDRAALLWGLGYNFLTVGMLAASAATSILVANDLASDGQYKLLAIVLPALSAFTGTILAQFRFREMWRLREFGRIATVDLVSRSQLLLAQNPPDIDSKAQLLEQERVALMRDQAMRFFGERDRKPGGPQQRSHDEKTPPAK